MEVTDSPVVNREQTPREELANCISHAIGLFAALLSAPFLIHAAVATGDTYRVVGAAVYSASMILLYLGSTLYHGCPPGRMKRIALRLDYSAIFVFIAGCYTPFTLGPMRGPWGWSLFGVVWLMALFGIVLKVLHGEHHPKLSMGLYLTMGWLVLAAVYPLFHYVPSGGLTCLLAGGVSYTTGVYFFANDYKAPFHHLRWHLFVLAGTAFHWLAIRGYAIG